MKIELTGIQSIHMALEPFEAVTPEGWVCADVTYCSICRTDAKLWSEGQRDLVLPRVPGHEFVLSYQGKPYTAWPGVACGSCKYCESGEENLCEDIQIIGFHLDGGFASKILIPEQGLVPLPETFPDYLGCFAEPAGCVINGFNKLSLQRGDRILIIGAGTVGLLAALMAKSLGAIPLVIEKNETKILKAESFSKQNGIEVLKETHESKFDCILNACADPLALMAGIPRLSKAGRFVHFSGLSKNELLETNLLNLIHYKELRFSGSYGLTHANMIEGLGVLEKVKDQLHLLIEGFIAPEQFESCLTPIINGEVYKYIVQMDAEQVGNTRVQPPEATGEQDVHFVGSVDAQIVGDVPEIDPTFRAQAREKMDNKSKPLGSLGKLEDLAVQMSCIQHNLNPVVDRKQMLVFAADHGIAEEGVSAFPQEVTGQMVINFLNNGAAINALCKQQSIDLAIVDMGVKSIPGDHPNLISKRIADGTKNFALQPAMSVDEAESCLNAGSEVFEQMYDSDNPIQVLGLGEMGIANTTPATAIICALTGESAGDCAGRGTGVDDQGLEHKIKVINKALRLHQLSSEAPLEVLAKIGGFEIGAIAGATLAAASKGCAVVIDGLISTAAVLIAYKINPDIQPYLIAGHQSVEKGHRFALEKMGLVSVLDLDMRLGEGSGAALTINLVDTACGVMRNMASFDEAGISKKTTRFENKSD